MRIWVFAVLTTALQFSSASFAAIPGTCSYALAATSNGEFRTESDPMRVVRTAAHDGRTMHFTAQAMTEMDKLDHFVRDREIVAEVAGYGLTKRNSKSEAVVVDFIGPRENHVLIVETLFIDSAMTKTKVAVVNSQRLTLEQKGGEIFVTSDKAEVSFSISSFDRPDMAWKSIQPILQKMTSEVLPESLSELEQTLNAKGKLPLNADWDMVVTGGSASPTDRYLGRVANQARAQGATADYTMHYHPQLGLAVSLLKDKPLAARKDYYTQHLTPSVGDLQYMNHYRIKWFEIRLNGTPEDIMSTTKTTSAFYNMAEIKLAARALRSTLSKLTTALNHGATEPVNTYSTEVGSIVAQISKLNVSIKNLVEFVVGKTNLDALREQLKQNNGATAEYILERLSDSRGSNAEISVLLDPKRLAMLEDNNILSMHARLRKLWQKQDDKGKIVGEAFMKYDLWNLPNETDPRKLIVAADFMKQLLSQLEH